VKWLPLQLPDPADTDKFKLVLRLNALGSLYFFEKVILQRNKLTEGLHKPILERLEHNIPRYLLEMPRDHYKTVMITEGRTMWRSLPFNDADEAAMRELGYDDAYIAWMRQTHNPNRRTLTVSEIIGNAIKIGSRIDWHYTENKMFKWVFEDIIPDGKQQWNNESKTHRSHDRGPQGEGTYDFLGVGGALQSRHYSDVNEDDVVGKEAIESQLVMDKTINYHQLLIGAFESYTDAAWTVVNNRWSPTDLSGWIREHQLKGSGDSNGFVIESHGALGGCCGDHPPDTPIFPEEFTKEILAEIRAIQGPYFFSHQYLNLAVNPEECIFNKDWLKFYKPIESPIKIGRHWLRHETVRSGTTMKDIDPNVLVRSMVVDPNHAGSEGRAHHAIVVTGLDPENDQIYLLDEWAQSTSYDDLMANIYRIADLWNLPEFWLETVAAQKYLKYHIEYRNKMENRKLNVRELKSDHSKNAKRTRIESLEPILRTDQNLFLNEYYAYPGGRTVDVLDCLGYAIQTWNAIHAKKILDIVRQRKERWATSRKSVTGY
jgi:hypothetical protein